MKTHRDGTTVVVNGNAGQIKVERPNSATFVTLIDQNGGLAALHFATPIEARAFFRAALQLTEEMR